VRTEGEWNTGHVEGALHVHGGLLQERLADIPKDRPIAVICGTGYRGSIAASFLQSQGYAEVANVLGGMSAWKAAGSTFRDPQIRIQLPKNRFKSRDLRPQAHTQSTSTPRASAAPFHTSNMAGRRSRSDGATRHSSWSRRNP
jgi:hypothetical protein